MLGDLLATTRKATVDGHAPDVAPVIIILAHHLLQELAKLRRGVGEGGSRGEATAIHIVKRQPLAYHAESVSHAEQSFMQRQRPSYQSAAEAAFGRVKTLDLGRRLWPAVDCIAATCTVGIASARASVARARRPRRQQD